ncbi:MAG: thiamine pyrophosphate-dependent enzyme, partial [Spirochaetota bacterium]
MSTKSATANATLDLYRTMLTAREMDLLEQDFTGRGEAFFHVSGAGHEACASLAEFLEPQDYLHVHYRDKALMLARGVTPEMFFMALFNKEGSHSRGRQMNAHMSAPELNILSLVGPVGNSALQAVGIAEEVKNKADAPVVLCGLGDGMTQQGEVLEGIAHAVRARLPVIFLVEDNAFAISTKTSGNTFYDRPDGPADKFYGIPIERIDGRKPLDTRTAFQRIVARVRDERTPSIIVFQVDRLHNHTNADDQRMYRTPEEIQAVAETGDPIRNLQSELVSQGYDPETLTNMSKEIREELAGIAREVQRSPEPEPIFTAKAPVPARLSDPENEYTGDRSAEEVYTMLEAIRAVLDERLGMDGRITLFGEDIEDPKGDVFGITRGLTGKYPGRIHNSPLAEASIIGISAGRALAGAKPVAFLQFADFLPIAYNQIWAELGSMWWRTDGGWQVPVIVMITCGGYRPGLGPFHASTLDGLAAHTPGVDVMMPATAGDAAGMLNAAFESNRPTLFFYPKNCLNDRAAMTSRDVGRQLVTIGKSRYVRRGKDITLVGYGNTVNHCAKAADVLVDAGLDPEVIDLRWLSPWDEDSVVESAEKTGRLVVVHEDNQSAGFGAEVLSIVSERVRRPVAARRVTRADTFVPCNFANQLEVLPGFKRTLETAVELFGGSVTWKKPDAGDAGTHLVEAIGSSPSDESVTVVEWRVGPGEYIESGQIVADLEADKAAVDLRAPVAGTVEELLVDSGTMVKVGTSIMKVRMSSGATDEGTDREHLKPVTREEPGEPILHGLSRTHFPGAAAARHATGNGAAPPSGDGAGSSDRAVVVGRRDALDPAPDPAVGKSGNAGPVPAAGETPSTSTSGRPGLVNVYIAGVKAVSGSRTVSNEEISQMCPDWSSADIVKRTGIESRQWLAEGETAVDLAERAVRSLLEEQGVGIEDISLIICATETPEQNTPAVSTLVQHRLAGGRDDIMPQAYDLNAACSGYLYALQSAHDYLQVKPNAKILVLTAESLSRRTDTSDPNTAPIFGDASSAT